ncbi:DEAD/DEAH box helicase family protein [Nocardia niigatensis]
MISAIKHAASIPNPEFYTRQRARRSTWDTLRFLRSYDETLDGDLILPRGLLALLTTLVESADSTLNIDDNRTDGSEQTFTWASELRAEQQTALRAVEAQDTCVLIAPPGTGKTVIACAAIASRATSTLILVDRKALADQWRTRILEHLGIKCGQIGGGRSKTTGVIDVALLPTLARRANVDELTRGYGFVVVDECHHIAASAFTDVLNQIPARYWLGLTATPYRARPTRRPHLPPTRLTHPHHRRTRSRPPANQRRRTRAPPDTPRAPNPVRLRRRRRPEPARWNR